MMLTDKNSKMIFKESKEQGHRMAIIQATHGQMKV
jgi:hypothetical protein